MDSLVYKGTTLSKKMAPSCNEEILEMQSKPYAQIMGTLMDIMLHLDLDFVVRSVS